MQLVTQYPIKQALFAATSALLANSSNAGEEKPDWEVQSALLLYTERGDRVNVCEPVIHLSKTLDNDDSLDIDVIVDVITGATPSGAMPSSQPQTFARPSGKGFYTIEPGVLPTDDTFQDTRLEVGLTHNHTLSNDDTLIYGGSVSVEYDYLSISTRTTWAHDYNHNNSTFSVGLALEKNELDPAGGVPTPLTSAAPGMRESQNARPNTARLHQADLLIGLTKVLSQSLITQFNLGFSRSSGYHNDPFKYFSIVDAVPGAGFGEPIDNLFENRPDSRKKQSIFAKFNYHLDKTILSTSYRYVKDDWDIQSHTLDIRVTFPIGTNFRSLQPHIRLYQQSAADFYRTNVLSNETLPDYVSPDYRLAEMHGVTYGIKYSSEVDDEGFPFEVRIEYITQRTKASAGSQIGQLSGRKIVPDTEGLLVQFNYLF